MVSKIEKKKGKKGTKKIYNLFANCIQQRQSRIDRKQVHIFFQELQRKECFVNTLERKTKKQKNTK
jgi:hypothetical protein